MLFQLFEYLCGPLDESVEEVEGADGLPRSLHQRLHRVSTIDLRHVPKGLADASGLGWAGSWRSDGWRS